MTSEERKQYLREALITLALVAVMWVVAHRWMIPTLLGDDYAGKAE